ncbi:MAG TPA: 3-dehydroquinate synthase [Hyphomicrobiaceae bacterium]|nr:3-dehydroquinate synthase [Hyphomicrobiaceae bacterium]
MTSPSPAGPVRKVHVALGARSYEVLIGGGLIEAAGCEIAARFPRAAVAIVTDETVAAHHLARLERALAGSVTVRGALALPPGERSKCFTELARLSEWLLERGVERGDLVIALGGGVIGDLAGFAAAIVRRGVRFVQIPTTLLAQVDSSVGGKTGINTPQGKNLAGAFHQPSLVLADTDVLTTLPQRELKAGYAEVAKYGLLGDAAFFAWLEAHHARVLSHDRDALTHAIETSVAMKAAIVARDETETGDRMLLNLGHTFGHALEAWAGFSSRLLHGEAVAIGMAEAFRYSERCGIAPMAAARRVMQHLRAVGLPTEIAHIQGNSLPSVDELMALMSQDKKVQRGQLTFILARGIGEAFVTRDVDRADLVAFMTEEIARPA